MTVYDIAEKFASQTTRSIFLTGKAGTGKTTFLRKLKEHCSKQIAIVAPTGVAAIHAGGTTMHSFFQLPFTPFVPTPEGRKNLISKTRMTGMRRKVLQELELLIIDEVSMVRADIMDEIDTILRHFRFRFNEPFGGVQLICIGDLHQLAPVAVAEEWQVLSSYYKTPYFFDSQVIQQYPLLYLEFDKIFRQSDDTFINILNNIRSNALSANDLAVLQQRVDTNFSLSKHPDHILLTTHNHKADRINDCEMARLKGREYIFKSQITGEFPEKSLPNHQELRLKEGAKVMFIANDTDTPRRYFNGKIGIIQKIDDRSIYVKCDDLDEAILVKKETWENIRYTVNAETKQIEEKKLGTYTQYPLRLAWAITIHKSQGLTFDKVAIDVEAAFASGQVYVALSRCRTLEGIILLSNIAQHSLGTDPNIVQFSSNKPSNEVLEENLNSASADYNQNILLSIFNFSYSAGQSAQIFQLIQEDLPLFNVKALNDLQPIKATLNEIASIGSRFCQQIVSLYSNHDWKTLKSRIASASDYFTKELDKVIKVLEHISVKADDKELASEYTACMESLHDDLVLKSYIIRNIKHDYSSEHYFKLKKKFKAKRFNVLCSNTTNQQKKWEKENKKDVKKEPVKKPSTYEITFELYNEGLSVDEIAIQRDLAVSTIERHIARLIDTGLLDLDEFLTPDQVEAIIECFEQGAELKDVFNQLGGNVSFDLLRLIEKRSKRKRKK